MSSYQDEFTFYDNRTESEKARDDAIRAVYSNTTAGWKEDVLEVVRGFSGETVTGEDIRLSCERRGIRPHHYNAWGAMIKRLITSAILHPTGRYLKSLDKSSHAHKSPEYRVTDFGELFEIFRRKIRN